MESREQEVLHREPPHREQQEAGMVWLQKLRQCQGMVYSLQGLVYEVYQSLMSSDFIWQSILYLKKNMAENPGSTVLYISLLLFGFLPVLCFCLFVCATIILWLVCFIFCQTLVIAVAGAMCAGMFFVIVIACCILATSCGLTVHGVSFLGQIYRVMALNAPEAVSYLRKHLQKAGIHLRLPEDDQS